MTERSFRIQTGHWHDNQGGHGMTLRIEDEISGETLVDIRLSPEQAYDFMRGSTLTLSGQQSPNLERVGKRMGTFATTYDSAAFGDAGWKDRDAKLKQAVEFAQQAYPDWEAYEPRHNNAGGVTVVLRKWVA